MKKIALPSENGLLCAHFGHCQQFFIYDIDENNNIINESILDPPEHEPGLYPSWLAQYKVSDVIAGGMGQKAVDIFNQNQINVYVGAPAKEPKQLVVDFLSGNLTTNANLCDH